MFDEICRHVRKFYEQNNMQYYSLQLVIATYYSCNHFDYVDVNICNLVFLTESC